MKCVSNSEAEIHFERRICGHSTHNTTNGVLVLGREHSILLKKTFKINVVPVDLHLGERELRENSAFLILGHSWVDSEGNVRAIVHDWWQNIVKHGSVSTTVGHATPGLR